MTNFKKQVFSVFAAGSMLVSVSTPVLASTSIQISGNGAGSDNAAVVNQTNTTTVSQSNTANVTNNVTSNADTGNNDAGYNTGGDVTIHTGDAKTTANVTNTLNSNAAKVAGCNCEGDTKVKISGNGAYSDNQVNLTATNVNSVDQTNDANVTNNVVNKAKTGDNSANSNTGGDVIIVTGDATANATVKTAANSNSAVIGGGVGANGSSASFVISGNGAGSDNWIVANLTNVNSILQDNKANIDNDVNSSAKTGKNDAGFNTGGDVVIATGDAKSGAYVDNMVNFNFADIDCGCIKDVLVKIDGNGASAHNDNKNANGVLLSLTNVNVVGQGNDAYLDNDVEAKAKTGYNDANKNTGSVEFGDDPAIITGDATNMTHVNNSGNVNTVGGTPVVLPLPGNTNLGFSFSMQALMAFFGWSM